MSTLNFKLKISKDLQGEAAQEILAFHNLMNEMKRIEEIYKYSFKTIDVLIEIKVDIKSTKKESKDS